MALDSQNVRVAVTGAVSMGATTAVAPIDADTAWAEGSDLGYVSEDGVTETRDRSSEQIRAWQNGDVVREVVTEANLTYAFTLIETKKETVELYYGNAVETNGSIAIVPSKTGGRHSFVIDVVDGDEYIRTYIPSGEITEVGDQVYANGEPVGYEVTITAYPTSAIQDASGANASARKWYSSLATAA